MIKAIIFDCFGVLVNDALESTVNELKIKHPDKAKRITNLVTDASKGLIDPDASRTAVADILGITIAEYANRMKNAEIKNQPLLNYIKELQPRFKLGLLSNIISGGLEVRFTSDELSMFDALVVSGEIGYAKPQAQAYEITAERLGVRLNECVMIDDREDYCQGATGVGMQAIQYQSLEQMKSDLEKLLVEVV